MNKEANPDRDDAEPIVKWSFIMKEILIITGDGGESYETLYARHRFEEAGFGVKIAAPSKKILNLVMHDFEPGWDTYVERKGYYVEADLSISEAKAEDYDAVLIIGGRAPEYLRNMLFIYQPPEILDATNLLDLI